MMSSNKLFSLKKQKISPKTTEVPFAVQLTTNVSINQDCIKSPKAELLRYLIMIEHNPV